MKIDLNFQQIFIICVLLTAEYVLVFLTVLADLVSGCRKAKKRGELRSSYGFRKTVDKLGRYYLPLFALTVVDVMQMIAIWYLSSFHDIHIPLFPIMTLIGAIGLGLIEIKSILEKAEDKVKFERVGELAGSVIQNKGDAAAIIAELVKYLKEENQDGKN
ncbi:MAG: phage holin family protein [Dysgonomonas sp.]